MVRKTSSKNSTGTIYKVTATYRPRFKTVSDAKAAIKKLAGNERAVTGKIKKIGNLFVLPVKFTYMVANAAARDNAMRVAKKNGASVSVSKR